MPLPNLSSLCLSNPTTTRPCITFPGGSEVCVTFPDNRIPDPSELINQLFAMVSSALAPFGPIFDIIDVLIAIVNCLKAVQKAIASFPPRPDELLSCFPPLAKAIAKLLSIVPALSIPVMVGELLDAIITFLQGLRNQLLAIIKKTLKLLVAQTKASQIGSTQLAAVVECAQADLDAYMANLSANAGPLGKLLQLINSLLGLAGINPLPGVQVGQDAQSAVAPLDTTIQALQTVRLAFP